MIHSYFELPKNVRTARLILQNPNNHYSELYPASRSFLFAEGLADCYQQAEYAQFKVDKQGNAILTALKGDQLQDLGCESKRDWLSGFRTAHELIQLHYSAHKKIRTQRIFLIYWA